MTDTPTEQVTADEFDIDALLKSAVDDVTEAAVVPIFQVYETDAVEEEGGRWFTLAPGAEFKVRRFTAKAVQQVRNKLGLAFRKLQNKDGTYPEHVAERIVIEQMGVVIADWRGPALVDREGAPLEYSPEAAKELMTHLPNLRGQLLVISMDMANYRTADRKEVEGN